MSERPDSPEESAATELPRGWEQDSLAWEQAGLVRKLALPNGIDFSSNDYLGLSQDQRVIDAAVAGAKTYGAGAAAARLLRGHHQSHERAEAAAARWCGEEAALLFPSGWQANAALIQALTGPEDVIFSDERNHASLIEGCRASKAKVVVFSHNDPEALSKDLARFPTARRRFVICEHVDSMDGDRAPLQRFSELCNEHDAWMLVDEAHAAGLFPFFHHPRVLARMFTGGKALGVAGGFVCGRKEVVHEILQRGRAFIFTTSVPPMNAEALAAAIDVASTEPERGVRAIDAAHRLRTLLAQSGVQAGGEGPLVPIVLGDPQTTMLAAENLQSRGFDVRGVRPPTVPEDASRLRIVCHAQHTEQDIERLASALLKVCPSSSSVTPPLLVCGTDTGIGKTVVSAILALALKQSGRALRYFKPVQTGDDCDTTTVRSLAQLSSDQAPGPGIALPLPASIDQAANHAGIQVTAEDILRCTFDALAEHPQAQWVLESAGGLRVPINDRQDQTDVLKSLNGEVVLVARSGLGTLNHTLLSLECAEQRGLKVHCVVLVGDAHPDNVESLAARLGPLPILQLPMLGEVSHETLLPWAAVFQKSLFSHESNLALR